MSEPDITLIADLRDLLEQATKEKSHFYVASVVRRCIKELTRLYLNEGEP